MNAPVTHCAQCWIEHHECAIDLLYRITRLVNEQAEDEGLWFDARTAPEAYLQQELRKLHRMIEADKE